MSIALLCLYTAVVSGGGLRERIQQELARIQHYELIHFNVDAFAESSTLSFSAYGEDYAVVLFPKDSLIASDIRVHSDTCHYGGHVVQPAGLDSESYLALSYCPHRGIRGSLTIGDEMYFVKPSACFLDAEFDRDGKYEATDEHLIYKVSDFDFEGLPHPEVHGEVGQSVQKQIDNQMVPGILPVGLSGQNRRRLATREVELFIIVDPSLVDDYKSAHTDWTTALSAWIFDMVNSASAQFVFYGTQYPTNAMGSIDMQMVKLEVIETWTGIYKSLKPPDWDSWACKTASGTANCIDGSAYLNRQQTWAQANGRNGYGDATHLLSSKSFAPAGGWGMQGCVCKTSCHANDNTVSGDAWTIRTIAHELGHNLGAAHDGCTSLAGGQETCYNSCGKEAGIMGYGTKTNAWSTCTRDYWVNYFNNNNKLTCLNSGFRTFTDNIGVGEVTTSNEDVDVNVGSGDCVTMSGASTAAWNGQWAYDGDWEGYPSYKRSNYYLHFTKAYGIYQVSQSYKGGGYLTYSYCTSVTHCTSWTANSALSVSSCSGASDTSATSAGCLRVANMYSSLNGEWTDLDITNNGQTVYQRGNYYLFYTIEYDNGTPYSYWTFAYGTYFPDSTGQNHNFDYYGYCPANVYDITGCGGKWKINEQTASSSTFTDCSTFISSDLACLEDTPYAEELCLSSSLLWNNATTLFAVSTEQCLEDQPLFVVADDAYHLHYSPYFEYTDDEELSPRWVLSESVVSLSGAAYCYQEDLRECVVGEWMIQTSGAESFDVEYVADALMGYGECGTVTVSSEEANEASDGTGLIVGIILVIAVVLAIIAGFFVYRRAKLSKIEVGFEEADEIEIDVEADEAADTTSMPTTR